MPTKVCLVKTLFFSVVMYGCESWTIKKAEHRRIDAFELWCWRRLLKVPWTARRSNQSILKEINPEYSLEGLMLKLKLQYFGHLTGKMTHLKRPWCWERMKSGGEGDNRGWNGWMASLTQWTWVWEGSGNWWWTGKPGVLQSMGSQRVRHDWATELTAWLTEVCHSFSSKEQVSFNFIAVATVCSDFGAQENKICNFPLFSPSLHHPLYWVFIINWYWILSKAFSLNFLK